MCKTQPSSCFSPSISAISQPPGHSPCPNQPDFKSGHSRERVRPLMEDPFRVWEVKSSLTYLDELTFFWLRNESFGETKGLHELRLHFPRSVQTPLQSHSSFLLRFDCMSRPPPACVRVTVCQPAKWMFTVCTLDNGAWIWVTGGTSCFNMLAYTVASKSGPSAWLLSTDGVFFFLAFGRK